MMQTHPASSHHRHSIRLKGYDYSRAGVYFVTIVTWGRLMVFGKIENGEMKLNRYGEIVQKWWDDIPNHFPNVETGAFVIMPNHVHGIIIITEERRGTVPVPHDTTNHQHGMEIAQIEDGMNRGGETPPLRRSTLGQIVAYFKYKSTKEINALDGGRIAKLWQRNYYEHIIRNEHEMENIWNYIESNPATWETDDENLAKR
jgi:REP element-mobilizing transposase RayT